MVSLTIRLNPFSSELRERGFPLSMKMMIMDEDDDDDDDDAADDDK